MKFSKNFERDYTFYFNNLDNFDFCGTLNPTFEAIQNGFLSAKECFFFIESKGVNYPTNEPDLLNKLLLCKAGINFQIKQWAESIADGTMLLFELSVRYFNERSKLLNIEPIEFKNSNLGWINGSPIYYADIESLYNLPEWVSVAVLNQAKKLMLN